mgnify:CR=1 FL=1
MPAGRVLTVPEELQGSLEFLGELALIPQSAARFECLGFYQQLEAHRLIRPVT